MSKKVTRERYYATTALIRRQVPAALSDKLGFDTVRKLCAKQKTVSPRKKQLERCGFCGSSQVYFRNGIEDGIRGLRCRDCHKVTPVNRVW